MKKLFTLLFASLVGVSALFADGTKIGDLYYILNESDKTAEVTFMSRDPFSYAINTGWDITEVIVPETVIYDGITYDVTSIGDGAFSHCQNLTSAIISNSVTKLGSSVFWDCPNLVSVTLSENLTNLRHTFYNCTGLKSINIPDNVNEMEGTFYGCSSLESVNMPEKVTTLIETFYECSSLSSIDIPNSVEVLGERAFYKCSSLSSIDIPNSVEVLGERAFGYCTGLTSITIPSSVKYFGNYPFSGCDNLQTVVWNAKNATGNSGPFAYDTLISSVIIGEEVEKIPNYFCSGLTLLKSINIPNSVTSIGERAFAGCSGLEFIRLGNNVDEFGENTFVGCSNLTSLEWNIINYNHYFTDGEQPIPNSITSITFGEDVEVIPAFLCYQMDLKSVTIPAKVWYIGRNAFFHCENLTSVIWKAKNCRDVTDKDYRIFPQTITSITFDEGVEYIPEYLCYGCRGLTSVNIAKSVATIGKQAFWGATQLETLTLGEGLRTIKEEVFKGCTNISTIYSYRPTPPVVNEKAFDDYLSRFDCKIHVLANSVDMYKVADVWKDFYYILPISSDKVDVTSTDVTVEAGDNSVTFTWPADNAAASYTIEIFKAGELVCTLTFNAKGQLEGIAFAPSRNENAQAPSAEMTAKGWQFTVSGLESATNYGYSLKALNESEDILAEYEGKFGTTGAPDDTEALTQIDQDSKMHSRKLLRNGKILILRGDHTYTLQGQEVK